MNPTRNGGTSVLQIDPEVGYGVRLYRVENVGEQLTAAGCDVRTLTLSQLRRQLRSEGTEAVLEGLDLLILHRVPFGSDIAVLLDACKQRGVTSAFEVDDLVFVPGAERWVDGVRQLAPADRVLYDEGVERYAATYRACDTFVASTSFLASLRPDGVRRAFVIPNRLGSRQLEVAEKIRRKQSAHRRRGDGIVLAYGAGSATHDRDFAVAGSALAAILQRHEDVRLRLIGPVSLPPALAGLRSRIECQPVQSWEDWWAALATSDVALAPLERSNPYCRAKSALKFLEASIVGVPTVASRIDEFEELIDDGRNGRLAGDEDEWLDALEVLVTSVDERRRLAAAAHEDTLERHTTCTAGPETRRTVQAMINGDLPARTGHGLRVAWLIPSPFSGSGGHSNIFRTIRSLVQRGHECTLFVDTSQMDVDSEKDLGAFVDRNFIETGARFRCGWNVDGQGFDAVIATSWATAETTARLDVPARLYFVQDFECLFFPAGEDFVRTEATYRLGLSCITLGQWLTDLMRERFDGDSIAFPFPVHIVGPVERPERTGPPTVAYYAQPDKARRGYRTGLEALRRFHAEHPECRILFFGSSHVDATGVPFPFEDRGILSEIELRDLYLEVDIGLVLSYSNPSLVSPNMMRCGCVVVDVDLENNAREYRSGHDSLLAQPTPTSLCETLCRLVEDNDLRSRLATHAMETVADRSEEGSVDFIESAIVRAVLTGRVEESRILEAHLGEEGHAHALTDGAVNQTLTVRQDGLCAVSVVFGTYLHVPDDVRMTVREVASRQIVGDVRIAGKRMRNDEWHLLEFDPVPDSAGREYEVELAHMEANAVRAAVYLGPEPAHHSSSLRINGESRPLELRLRAYSAGNAAATPLVPDEAFGPVDALGVENGNEPPAARRIAELLHARSSRHRELRVDWNNLTGSVISIERTMDRLRSLTSIPFLRRPLRALKVAPSSEVFVDDVHFVTPELREGACVSQDIAAPLEGLCGVSVRFATEGRKGGRPVRVRLMDGDEVTREAFIPSGDIQDNIYTRVSFKPIPNSTHRRFRVELTTPGELRGMGTRVWGRRDRGPAGFRRRQNGRRVTGRLDLELHYLDGATDAKHAQG